MQNRITKGVKAEHFALRTLIKNGFKIADVTNYEDLRYIDFVIEKKKKHYKIQIKGWIDGKRPLIHLTNYEKDDLGYIKNVLILYFLLI